MLKIVHNISCGCGMDRIIHHNRYKKATTPGHHWTSLC